jgi:lipoate-protein ligase A
MSIVFDNNYLNEIFGCKFELIHSGHSDGQFNMDFDYNRAMELANGTALPMLRGWGLVRRPTGGRAVLHASELTYSVVVNLDSARNVQDLYREIHKFLLKGLKLLISNAELADELDFEKSQPDLKDFYRQSGFSVSCFASSARYEIAFRGRKIVGSAQRLFGNTLLQHGSIILNKGHEQLACAARVDTQAKKNALEKYINNHSISLTEVCGREINYNECLLAIISILGITNINF